MTTDIDRGDGALKRALFLFDRLALVNLPAARLALREVPHLVADLDWLHENGYAVDLKDPTPEWRKRSRGVLAPPFHDIGRLQAGIVDLVKHLRTERAKARWSGAASSSSSSHRVAALEVIEQRLIARVHTVHLSTLVDTHAVLLHQSADHSGFATSPLGPYAQLELDRLPAGLRSVANLLTDTREETTAAITLRAFPVPSGTTPLYEVTAFRREHDSQQLFSSLKEWMNRVSRGDLPPAHIEDELAHLIASFERHLKLAGLQYERSTITLLTVAVAEFAEELIRFRFSKAFTALGAFRRERVLMLQAEATAPGRELAYLIKARRKFARAG